MNTNIRILANQFLNLKNRIINGDFSIWQRGTSYNISTTNHVLTKTPTADNFFIRNNTDGVFNISKSSFNNKTSYKCTVNTPPTNITNFYFTPIVYKFEGNHLFDIAKNRDKYMTLSFWFNSNVTGKYSATFVNETGDFTTFAHHIIPFDYLTANTPTFYSFKIDMTYNWNVSTFPRNDINKGFVLFIGTLNNGVFTVPNSSLNRWVQAYRFNPQNSVNWGASTGNFIEIAEIQLEEGTSHSNFERIPYDIQLFNCRRYYEPFDIHFSSSELNLPASNYARTVFLSEKRTTPTITITGATSESSSTGPVSVDFISNNRIVRVFANNWSTNNNPHFHISGYASAYL